MNNSSSRRNMHKLPGHQGNPYNILPPTDILEQYEEVSQGSVGKLLEMAKNEQKHRHGWQEKHLEVHSKIYKWGQIFSFLYNVLLLGLVSFLIKDNQQDLALKIFTINALLMAFAIIVTYVERKAMNRRPPRKFSNKNHNKKTSHKIRSTK